VCGLSACHAEPQFAKETEGVNHQATYRIIIKGNVADVNGLKIEARKTRMKELTALSSGEPITPTYIYPYYFNELGIEFFSADWKDHPFGEIWPESDFEKRHLSYMEVVLQQIKMLESHPCTDTEYMEQRKDIDRRNSILKEQGALGKIEQISRNECDRPTYALRPTHPFSGYLEVDNLALPVGRKMSFAEVQARRKAIGLPPLERHFLDTRGVVYHGYSDKKKSLQQTWEFDWPEHPVDEHDRNGTERYLKSICVGQCP